METIVIRVDLDPDTAEVVESAVLLVGRDVHRRLADTPPVHTQAALERQRDALLAASRELARARANPVQVEAPGTPESAGESEETS